MAYDATILNLILDEQFLQANAALAVGHPNAFLNTIGATVEYILANPGPTGADGKTVRNGAGAPSGGLGAEGDFYIDTAADAIYGPKTAGAWGSSTSLIGPTGATGATGAAGTNGATWTSGSAVPSGGADGDHYLRTTNGDVYLKTAGTWSVVANITGPAGSLPSGAANLVVASPDGSSGTAALRALAANDLPVATTSARGGVVLASDRETTAGEVVNASDPRVALPYQRVMVYDHFLFGPLNDSMGLLGDTGQWGYSNSGPIADEAGHNGIVRISSPSTSSGAYVWGWNSGSGFLPANLDRVGFLVRLSGDTGNARYLIGLGDNPDDDSGGSNSLCFLYDPTAHGNIDWYGLRRSGGSTLTYSHSSAAASGDTFLRLEIRRGATTWDLYVDGFSIETSLSTAAPTSALYPFARVILTLGSTAAHLDVDTFWLEGAAL